MRTSIYTKRTVTPEIIKIRNELIDQQFLYLKALPSLRVIYQNWKENGMKNQRRSYLNTKKALWRDNFQCRICHKGENLEVHHVVELSIGGDNSLNNMVTLCKPCHLQAPSSPKRMLSIIEAGISEKSLIFGYCITLALRKMGHTTIDWEELFNLSTKAYHRMMVRYYHKKKTLDITDTVKLADHFLKELFDK